jgi:hypothetical protein
VVVLHKIKLFLFTRQNFIKYLRNCDYLYFFSINWFCLVNKV